MGNGSGSFILLISVTIPAIVVILTLINGIISYDVAPGSEIMPCNKIDKRLEVCRFFGKSYDIYNKVSYIMTTL